MKKLRNIIFLINIFGVVLLNISLQGCNSGGSASSGANLFSKNLESGDPSNNSGIPFDGTRGYDSIHQRLAIDNCFKTPTSWYATDNHINFTDYYYTLNEQSIENKVDTDAKLAFHDSDHMLLENSSLSGHYSIEKKLEHNWSMYGINIYGYGQQGYTVGYSTSSMNSLSAILNSEGQEILLDGAKKYPKDLTQQYEYFTINCGDHLINSWDYKQYIIAQLIVSNNSLEIQKKLKKHMALSGGAGTGILPVGIDGTNSAKYDISSLMQTASDNSNLSFFSFGTGNQASTEPEACDSSSKQNCFAQIVDPFFKLVYNWKQANPRTLQGHFLATQPYPGTSYLPPSEWTGNFSKYSIANLIVNHLNSEGVNNVKIPTKLSHPEMFAYATMVNIVNANYNKLNKMLALFNSFSKNNYCSSHQFSGQESCETTLNSAITSLTSYLNKLENENNDQNGSIFTYCFASNPDSSECLNAINKYQNPNDIPYDTLLKFQNNSQQIHLSRIDNGSVIGDLVYDANNLNTDGDIGIYKFSRGDSSPSMWGGNNITPQYLVSDAGDYVSTFLDAINNPYNIYVVNGISSNSLYAIPGAYTTPLNTQNLHISRVNQARINIDGNFQVGGDVKLYENLDNLIPGSYIYAKCPQSICTGSLRGYLLIVDNNLNLYEYAVSGRNYDLYQIWSEVDNNINSSEKIVSFDTSSGVFGIYNSQRPDSTENLYLYNPYSSSGLWPTDGVRRYALKLNSVNGHLDIYKNHDESAVWSNADEITTPMPTQSSIPTIPNSSFWYKNQVESSESSE